MPPRALQVPRHERASRQTCRTKDGSLLPKTARWRRPTRTSPTSRCGGSGRYGLRCHGTGGCAGCGGDGQCRVCGTEADPAAIVEAPVETER